MIGALILCILLAVMPYGIAVGQTNDVAVESAALTLPGDRDGGSLDQGGETCTSAAVIPSLPYCDTGSTAGRVNDYTPPCVTGSVAPDVVYRYTPTTTQIISASTCGSSFNTVLHIWRGCPPSGTLICCNDDAAACAPQSCCTGLTLAPGQTYFFIVDGAGNASGNYSFQVVAGQTCPAPCDTCRYPNRDWEPGNNTCVNNDIFVNCNYTLCGEINPATDLDWYTFRISGSQCLIFRIDVYGNDTPGYFPFGRGLDPKVFLYAVDCATMLANDDNSGVGNDAQLVSNCLQPGVYRVLVQGVGGTLGPYVLSLSCQQCTCPVDSCDYRDHDFEPSNNNCLNTLAPLSCPDTICAEISPQDDVDFYAFQIAAPSCQMVTIDVFGNDTPGWYPFGLGLNPIVYLIGSDCATILAFDDNGGTGNDSRLVSACLPPGTYHIRVEGAGAAAPSTGPYILALACQPCQCPCDVVCPANGIPEGEPCPNFPDNYNGGCNSTPPIFGNIFCGQTICGTSYATSAYRDTDWWQLQLIERDTIWWCVTAEFPVEIAIMQPGILGCADRDTIAYGTALTCSTVCIGACLNPGYYALYVAPLAGNIVPCSDYVARLNCTICTTPDICPYRDGDLEPNGICTANNPTISCPDTVCGEINPANDGDYYQIRIPSGTCQIVTIDVFGNDTPGWWPFGQGLNPHVCMYDAACTMVVGCDYDGGVGNDAHFVSPCLPAGLYSIRVGDDINGTSGPYILALACEPCPCSPDTCPYPDRDFELINNTCETFNPQLQCGDTLCGEISFMGDVDWYLFNMNVAPCGIVTIDIFGNDTPGWFPFGGGLNPIVWLVSLDCSTVIAMDDNGGTGTDSRLVSPCIPPGLYHIRVEGTGTVAPTVGPYILATACTPCECPQDTCPYPDLDFEPNNECTSAQVVLDCNSISCGEIRPQGDDDWYIVQLPDNNQCYQILLNVYGNGTPGWYPFGRGLNPSVWLFENDCITELGGDDDGGIGGDSWFLSACLQSGTYRILVQTGGDGLSSGPYILAVACTICPCPCQVPCPAWGIPEGEPCPNIPDHFNGGCNSVPPSFSQINCNTTICGTASSGEITGPDTDWYLLTTREPDTIWWCVTAEFPVEIAIFAAGPAADPCRWLDTLDCGRAETCSTVCVGACVQPGTYLLYVTPLVPGVMPCKNYVATLNCTICSPPVVEAPDSVVIYPFPMPDINLYWPPVPGATNYYIYRDTIPSVSIVPANFQAATPDTFYIDSGISATPAYKYFYTVTTHRRQGCTP
jgi:hypothetical protein